MIKAKEQTLAYHDRFATPGISPFSASPRKHRRQRPNLRRKARGRPQMLQRLRCWVENLGFLFVLAIFAVVAIFSFYRASRPSALSYWPLAFSPFSSLPTLTLLQTGRPANEFASFTHKLIASC